LIDITLPLLRLSLFGFNSLPLPVGLRMVELVVGAYFLLAPKGDRVSLRNLRLVFPEDSNAELKARLKDAHRSLARFIFDSARFHTLDEAWVKAHVEAPFEEAYHVIKKRNPSKGILIVGGHLGSIEIQALSAPFIGRRLSVVARNLKNKGIDLWWKNNRQRFGNQFIDRKGAVSKILANLRAGIDVAILIDQNVRREHALFVDWFGKPAATTFAFGRAAVETEAPVVLSAITYLGNEKYRLNERECDLSAIYSDQSLSPQEKALEVTKRVSIEYQKMILDQPSEWFWLHRRWKTTPEGVPEDFY